MSKAERARRYNQSPKGKERQWRYEKTPIHREARRRYSQSPLGRENSHRFYQTPKGQETRRRNNAKRDGSICYQRVKEYQRKYYLRRKGAAP